MGREHAEQLREWVGTRTRSELIHQHGFTMRTAFWHQIADLPGAPVTGAAQAQGKIRVDRGQLFGLAAAATEDDSGASALKLLWHTLAWGTGSSNRNNGRRITAVRKDPHQAGRALQQAAEASQADPERAFGLLHPGNRNLISYLGPNFSTKYLYFAGAGNPQHPCLIVDSRVLASLYQMTDDPIFAMKPHQFHYGVRRYLAATENLKALADEASTAERPIAYDEAERWAFETAR